VFKKTIAALCTLMLATLGAGFAAPAHGETIIRVGDVGEPGSLLAWSAEEFAKEANAKLGDTAKVEVYNSSQLGNDTQLLQKLKLGTVDIALPSTVMSSVAPDFALFEMPFLIKDRAQMARIAKDPLIRGALDQAAAHHGSKIIGLWENGFRDITNNRRPIVKPSDLQGIKLRTPNGVWRVRMFKAYGADPTPMPYSEVFVALQTGAVDGEENPLAQIYPARFFEVQKYLSISHHVYTPTYVLTGASWTRLPDSVRQILEETATDMQPEVLKKGAEMDQTLLAKLEEKGMKVNDIDRQAFIAASAPIYQDFEKQVEGGKALVDEAQRLGAQQLAN
jgi:TRAP-type transport system periplasmic protein